MKNIILLFSLLIIASTLLAGCSPIGESASDERSSQIEIEKPIDDSYKPYNFYDRAFPDNNIWNKDISNEPVDPDSDLYITSLGNTGALHADFGTIWDDEKLGMPINVVTRDQALVPISFLYADHSDRGPYPIAPDSQIQHGQDSQGDRHLIVVDVDNGLLYEMYRAFPDGIGGWTADSGAIFDLKRNLQRPDNWTSADAAGLPIFPALVRYEEVVNQKEIRHALRVTANKTRRAYVFPATHQASPYTDTNLPPMGARLRLKASFDISGYSENIQVILKAMKVYGMFIADNGVSWQITGDHHMDWDDQELQALRTVPGSAFEVIKLPPLKYTPW